MRRPFLITCGIDRFEVLRALNLDDEQAVIAEEVDHERTDRPLPAELVPAYLPVAQP